MSDAGIKYMVSVGAQHFQRRRSRRTVKEVKERLRGELQSDRCRNLQSVAESLGYNSTSTLYQADADLCRQISDRHTRKNRNLHDYVRPNEQKRSDAEIESALNEALSQRIPPRLKDIVLKLGYSGDHPVRYRFPRLVQAVIERRNEWEGSQRQIRRKVLEAAILEVPPPSIFELSRRHGSGLG